MKRYCVCVLWDKHGEVLDYVIYYLKALQAVVEKLVVVVNGKLSEQGRQQLEVLNIDIMQRNNDGYDFGGWKHAIKEIGYDELAKYDELILTNTTCYGPIFPLSEMFEEMENRDCDFWGITKHPTLSGTYIVANDKKSEIIEHLQSYFIAYKKNVFLSEAFKSFWENLALYNDYSKITGYQETKLTNHLEKAGFKSDSYIDLDFHKNIASNPMFCTEMILDEYRLPLIKRKAIVMSYCETVRQRLGQSANKLLEFIKDKTDYDTEMIYQDILKNRPMSEIKSSLHLNYILPSSIPTSEIKPQKIALILHIYYEDLVEYCFNYIKSMPKGTDIYIVSPKQSTLDACKGKAAMLADYDLIYRLKKNRGRDVSAYLVECKDVFENYDLICCMHDKKTPQEQARIGADFQYHCFECNLKSKEYVKNLINIFDTNSKIGLLVPSVPCFADFITLIGCEIANNEKHIKLLYDKLKLKVSTDDHAVAPFGSMFWIRGKAITPLYRYNWGYEDFPEEPLPPDGTISHAIERIYPAIVQEAGYLTGCVMPDSYAALYIDNLVARTQIFKPNPITYKPLERIFSIKNSLDKKHKIITISGIKLKLKRHS